MESDQPQSRVPGFKAFLKIGGGTYSKVYSAVHVETGARVAVKAIDKSELLKEGVEMETIYKEVDVHRQLLHPNIATFFGSYEDEGHCYFIIELAAGQSLLNAVNLYQGLCEEAARKNFVQLICAVKYLHENKGVIHRDIKLDNILFDASGTLKLLDFGFGNTGKEVYSTQCGSYPYVAPELFSGKSYTSAIDIWSCGVVLYAMLTGKLPFYSDNISLLVEQIQHSYPDFSDFPSDEAIDLVHKMLTKDPARRIGLADICKHAWVRCAENAMILALNYEKMYDEPGLKRKVDWEMKRIGKDPEDPANEMVYRIVRQQAIGESMMSTQWALQRVGEPKIAMSMVFPVFEDLEGSGRRASEPDRNRNQGYRESRFPGMRLLSQDSVTPVRVNCRRELRRSMHIPSPTFL